MKKYLLIAAFAALAFVCNAQEAVEDVLYLKSGKVVRGTIVSQNSSEVIIKIMGRYKFVYAVSEIERTAKEAASQESIMANQQIATRSSKPVKPASPKGYYGMVDLAYGAGSSDYGIDFLKLNFINGYRINPQLAVGIGIGARNYASMDGYFYPRYDYTLPVFLDVRYAFLKSKLSPFVAVNLGYAFDDMLTGIGSNIGGNAGLKVNVGRKSAFFFGLGYEVQDKMVLEGFDLYELSEEKLGAITINAGFSF